MKRCIGPSELGGFFLSYISHQTHSKQTTTLNSPLYCWILHYRFWAVASTSSVFSAPLKGSAKPLLFIADQHSIEESIPILYLLISQYIRIFQYNIYKITSSSASAFLPWSDIHLPLKYFLVFAVPLEEHR